MGKTPARDNPLYWGGGNKWISIADIKEKCVSDTKECISDLAVKETKIKIVPKGTLIMSFKLSVGKVAFTAEDMYTNEAIMAFIDRGKYPIDMGYLFYYLGNQNWRKGANKAVKGLTLNKKSLSARKIVLPSLDTQRDVTNTLNLLDRAIQLCQQLLEATDTLVKARFVELFGDMFTNEKGWEQIPLPRVAEIVSGITKGRRTKETELTEVPYMAVSNVKDGYIDWSTIKTILATASEIEQYRLLPYDVLMTEGGDPDKLGRGAIIHMPLENCIHQNHIFRVRLKRDIILPEFFAEYLQHPKAKQYFLSCAKQTTGIASINMSQLRAMPLLCPPLSLQTQFAAFVSQTDKSKLAVTKCLQKAEYLRSALIQQYFG